MEGGWLQHVYFGTRVHLGTSSLSLRWGLKVISILNCESPIVLDYFHGKISVG